MKKIFQKMLKNGRNGHQAGFTIMEIVVATAIFAFVFVAILSMFNYVLKINRKSDALRQSSQDMRNMVEFITKEVRNGSIVYNLSLQGCLNQNYTNPTSSYLSLKNVDGANECIYYNSSSKSIQFVKQIDTNPPSPVQSINPANFTVDYLSFYVRPVQDPCLSGAQYQPMVEVVGKFTVTLPTKETVPLYYQTAISTDKYSCAQ